MIDAADPSAWIESSASNVLRPLFSPLRSPRLLSRRSLARGVAAAGLGLLLTPAVLPGISPFGLDRTGAAQAQSKAVVLRIGHQKFDPLTLVKFRSNLLNKLGPLGVSQVQWVEFPSGPPILEALNAGSIDIGRTGDTPPIVAQAAGTPFVYVGTSEPKNRSSGILVKADSPILRLSDLRGRKVGFAKGSSAHWFIIRALQSAGLSFSDITPVYLAPADARSAFAQGAIDAWVIWDPFYAVTQASPGVRVLRRETQAVSRWASRNDEAVVGLLAPQLKIDPAALRVVTGRRDFSFVPLTAGVVAEQQQIADSFAKLKLIPRPIRVQRAVDPAFLR